MTSSSPPQTRKPGRPKKRPLDEDSRPLLSCEVVVEAAYRLCDGIQLEDLTLNDVATALDVSTTTIRHHIKTRRKLTKLLVDRHFRELRDCLPPLTYDWRTDLDNFLSAQTATNSGKPGFAAFFFEHRFEPEIDPFGTQDGMFVSRRMLQILRNAGLGPNDVALAWHMAMHLVLSIGYAESRGQTPADQTAVFDRIGLAVAGDSEDRAVIAAMGRVDLSMIYANLSSMLKHAVAIGFAFPPMNSDPVAAVRPPRVGNRRA